MKTKNVLALLILLLFCFSGCRPLQSGADDFAVSPSTSSSSFSQPTQATEPSRTEDPTTLEFETRVIQGFREATTDEEPVITVIDSQAEMQAYCVLEMMENPELQALAEAYDAAFFEGKTLIAVEMYDIYGGSDYVVTDIRFAQEWELRISMDVLRPREHLDPTLWLVFLELKGSLESGTEIRINLTEKEGWVSRDPNLDPGTAMGFEAEYFRVSSKDGLNMQDAYIINSVVALEQFCETYGDDSFVGNFEDAVLRYDEAFFESHTLLIVYAEEASGSFRHQVTGVARDADGSVDVTIDRLCPNGSSSDDVGYWYITVEVGDKLAGDTAVYATYSTKYVPVESGGRGD